MICALGILWTARFLFWSECDVGFKVTGECWIGAAIIARERMAALQWY